jgi:Spy/CpxP family protein refolding chaperone
MKPAKSIAIVAIVMLLAFALANAQTATTTNPPATNKQAATPPMSNMSNMKMANMTPMSDSARMEHHISMMKDNLGLSETQVGQIRTIMENENKQMMADREKYSSDTKGMQKARKELRTSTDKDIKAVLTADQVKKYDEMQKQMQSSGQKNWKKANETSKTKTDYKQK